MLGLRGQLQGPEEHRMGKVAPHLVQEEGCLGPRAVTRTQEGTCFGGAGGQRAPEMMCVHFTDEALARPPLTSEREPTRLRPSPVILHPHTSSSGPPPAPAVPLPACGDTSAKPSTEKKREIFQWSRSAGRASFLMMWFSLEQHA